MCVVCGVSHLIPTRRDRREIRSRTFDPHHTIGIILTTIRFTIVGIERGERDRTTDVGTDEIGSEDGRSGTNLWREGMGIWT